jgi:hypothetical protein
MLRYRLRTTTLGVYQHSTRPVAISIPAGTILNVPDDFADATGSVEVEWDRERIHMFAVDIRERGDLIKTRNA